MLQNLIMSSLAIVDMMMVGQMGEVTIAGVSLASQIYFIFSILLFGTTTGTAIFTAQYWGKKDIPAIHRALGLCLLISVGFALILLFVALVLPAATLSIFTTDQAVIAVGTEYLQIVAWSYLLIAISGSFSVLLRSIEQTRAPMMISGLAFILNTGLNYVLIFGNFGFPALGAKGAAVATLISRSIELTLMLAYVYGRRTPLASTLQELNPFQAAFIRRYFKTVSPVLINEIIWSIGYSVISVIFGRMGTDSLAAYKIVYSIESLAFVAFLGIGNACAVMVGKKIGEGREDMATQYVRWSLMVTLAVAVVLGGIIILAGPLILSGFKVTPETAHLAWLTLIVDMAALWIRGANFCMIIGGLRAGGDTRYTLFTELGTLWFIGIPFSAIGAFFFGLPVYWVLALTLLDEGVKVVIMYFRFRSNKWINRLAHTTV